MSVIYRGRSWRLLVEQKATPVPLGASSAIQVPRPADLDLRVEKTGEITRGAKCDYVSGLDEHEMVTGLPDEFAEAVMDGFGPR